MCVLGEMDFYQECMGDDERTFEIIDHYRTHRKKVLGTAGSGSTKSVWQAAAVKQSMYKESGVDVIGVGVFMCKRRFCQWVSDRPTTKIR